MSAPSVYSFHQNTDVSNAITPQQVKAILVGQVNGINTRKSNPLEYLALVEQIVSSPDFPRSSHARKIVLVEILDRLIVDELTHHRQIMGINKPSAERTKAEVLQAIVRDQRTANRELLGWSWLYYGYVRVDLYIQMQEFAEVCHINERTLRRYQDCVLSRLTELLIKQEWAVRRDASDR